MEILSKYIHPGMDRYHAKNVLFDRRLPTLGSGQSTTAFSVVLDVLPEVSPYELREPEFLAKRLHIERVERVLRISTNETGMRTTIAIAMKHQDDPYAPKVYETMELTDGFACVMEALRPCTYLDRAKVFSEGVTSDRRDEDGRPEGFSDTALAASPYLREITSVLGKEGIRFDLHAGNFAYRGRQLVVLDPLYSMEKRGPLPEYDPKGWERRNADKVRMMHDEHLRIMRQAQEINLLMQRPKRERIGWFDPISADPFVLEPMVAFEDWKPGVGLDKLPKAQRAEALNQLNGINHAKVRN